MCLTRVCAARSNSVPISRLRFLLFPLGFGLFLTAIFFQGGMALSTSVQARLGCGQGLTDEFRQLYPPEDQNCWNSHCHGNVTYENGFTIPKVVPAVIGPGALKKFGTAANLFGFTKAVMPFQRPAALSDEEYYQIISYLLRENKLWTAREGVTASNAGEIQIGPPAAISTPQPVSAIGIKFYAPLFIGLVVLILLIGIQRSFGKK